MMKIKYCLNNQSLIKVNINKIWFFNKLVVINLGLIYKLNMI